MSENESREAKQYKKMIETPVWKLISTLAVPTVISMLITGIYNMADTYFVSKLGTEASAAVGIMFPVMSIIQACGFTLGMGSSSLISRRLGERKDKEASVIASTSFFAAIFIGLCIAIVCTFFSSSLMRIVGASETILPFATQYGGIIFIGAPFMCASFVLNNVLRSEGKANFSMIALTSGGILNIFLDPLFIFTFGLGIRGAAIATILCQITSFFILLSFFLRKKAICSIKLKLAFRKPETLKSDSLNKTKELSGAILWSVICTGFPSLCRQGLSSFATILLNRAAGTYGNDAAIAGMAIVTRIVMLIASVMIGIGQGFSPVCGYNYGAKRYDRVKQAFTFTITASFIMLGIFSGFIAIFANQIVQGIRNDPAVIKVGTTALRYQLCLMPFHSVIITTNMLMQSTGHVKAATFLSCNRQGVFFIPVILLLPPLIGILGVELAQTIADGLSTLAAIPYIFWFFKKINQSE
ncbi:MAG: MATE family efflux transporter [Treponema sp.]|nr:MATE family efflux transporter [Treponema sp.]